MDFINSWIRRHIADKQLVILVLVMAAVALAIYLVGGILTPVIAAVVISYLLQGAINRLVHFSIPRWLAFWIVFLGAMAGFVLAAFGLVPVLFHEVASLVQQVPSMMTEARRIMAELPARYPDVITADQVNQIYTGVSAEVLRLGQQLLSVSFTSALTAITVAVYLVLVPFMVFFMVRDKDAILAWILNFLPQERHLTNQVWRDIDGLIDRYIQGKVWEILIVGSATYLTFILLGLEYALLLAAITGFSVLIPYIGAFAVSIPVAFVAFYQFGFGIEFTWIMVAYIVIQVLDGNVLVPVLFGEAVDLHPVAIIIAVLFFGGLWGFWGVFFAIPLATVFSAVIKAWRDLSDIETAATPAPDAAAGANPEDSPA